ncbi:MAG TPA: SDR family NAD(P)-dependent oxidoreductase [Longimicrobiales bacterium]|nr:SDR family NAD(P)-dependent oxidoreductase [Longimicrobiales bacterium]
MNRIQGKVALVTGASAGIGEACARRFAAEGADLALWARREGRLEALAEELTREHGVHVHRDRVDVRDRADVRRAAAALLDSVGPPHIVLNNAGLASGLDPVHEGDFEDWDRMIDTNVKGLLNVTRLLLPAMIEAGRGHVINIGSTAGHQVYPRGNVYNATKFAVTALTEAINLDLAGTALRVSSVDPGFVETEFSEVRFHGDRERAAGVYRGFQPLTGDDVADAVAYVANLPAYANVLRMVLVPTAQRSAYIVDREQPSRV